MATIRSSSNADSTPYNLRPSDLVTRWSLVHPQPRVVGFYGHTVGLHRSFSNFYAHGPISFRVPDWCWNATWASQHGLSQQVSITFSEKSIMLCKAALFEDHEAYRALLARHTVTPRQCKSIGRGVKGFRSERWGGVVLSVAFEVVYQKFSQLPNERSLLLNTGNSLIAEASPTDAIWGIGCGLEDHDILHDPRKWKGSNILGWALMEARDRFQVASSHSDDSRQEEQLYLGVSGGGISDASSDSALVWSCPSCTFSNSIQNSQCEVCSATPPATSSSSNAPPPGTFPALGADADEASGNSVSEPGDAKSRRREKRAK